MLNTRRLLPLSLLFVLFFVTPSLFATVVGTTKGEFFVNQGTANYTIKIDVPPGVAGMVPKLSLNYNSNDGNGYMGLGWSIGGISEISRCPQTKAIDGANYVHGIHYDERDRYCLDGQRLIVVKGDYGADNSEYRTETDNYSRITQKGVYGSGGANWFEVKTKSGLTYRYGLYGGTSGDASAYFVINKRKVFWRVTDISDSYGNKIVFHYKNNYKTGENYLRQVTYADNSIDFMYESRPDKEIGYSSGHLMSMTVRLKEVIVKTGSTEIRRYKVAYTNETSGAKRSKVASIAEYVPEGELKKLTMSYGSQGELSFSDSSLAVNDFGYREDWRTERHPRVMSDVNGDGLPDIVGFGHAGVYVSLNQGNGSFEEASLKLHSFGYSQGWRTERHLRVMSDVNGDGLPDIVGFGNDGVYVSLNKGEGSFAGSSLTIKNFGYDQGWQKERHPRVMSDVNGDGLPDIVGFGHAGVYVSLNQGNGSFEEASLKLHSFGYSQGWRTERHLRVMSDVNGDGLPDIVGFGNDGVFVSLNNRNGFSSSTKWISAFGYNAGGWRTEKHLRMMSDVNGDGLPDVVGFGNDGVSTAINKCKQPHLTHITNNTDQDIYISYKNMTDKSAKIYAQLSGRNTKPWNSISRGNIPVIAPMNLVYSVKNINGAGGFNEVQYKYHDFNINKLHGSQGFRYIITYDMATHMASGTFYKQIGVKNSTDDTDGYQFTGMPYYTYSGRAFTGTGADKKLDTWGKWLSRTYISYKDASHRDKIHEPYTYSNIQTVYDPDSKEPIKTIYHYNVISTEGLGNIIKTIDKTHDYVNEKDFYKTIINEYGIEDRSTWHIGRLTKATVTHTQTDGDTVVRSSTFKYNDKGVLSEEVANAGTDMALTKTFAYDKWGNKIKETISGAGVKRATTTWVYTDNGKFIDTITNAAGLTEKHSYDPRFGTLISLTGPNGLTTTWKYDGLGRKIEELRADGTWSKWEHFWYKSAAINSRYVYWVKETQSGTPYNTATYYDSLGRETSKHISTLGNKRVLRYKYYNAKGELYKESLPYISKQESAHYIVTTYDKYGRAIKVTKPGPNDTTQTYTTYYKNFTAIVTDPRGTQKATIKNAIDQTIKIIDAYGIKLASSITYKYDAAGNLLGTTDAKGNVVAMLYDAAGNKIYMHDPDLGVWHYQYNAAGQLIKQWSGTEGFDRSKHATYKTYDVLGRLTKEMSYNHIEYNSDNDDFSYNQTTYVYGDTGAGTGSRGKLVQTVSTSHMLGGATQTQTITRQYDRLGRVVAVLTNIAGRGDYLMRTSYDAFSRPSIITYPNGYEVTYHYTDGILDSVQGSDGKLHYQVNQLSAFGKVVEATFGNGVKRVVGYDSAGYIGTILSGQNGTYLTGTVQQLHYSYDAMGNVLSRLDNSIEGHYLEEKFRYDGMNRLSGYSVKTDIEKRAFATSCSYQYDRLGNITYKSGYGEYVYYADKPHAVKSVGKRSYRYDAVGNMTYRNGDTITYNPLNKPATLSNHLNNATVTFTYGAGQQRYMKQTSEGVYTFYLGKSYEEQVENNTEKQICYITLGGKTIGTHTEIKNTNYPPDDPNYNTSEYNRYFHTDALGSITAVTDDTGTVVERRSYEPFGKIRAMDYGLESDHRIVPANTVTETARAYTGHEQIKEIDGLIHMNARVYDSDIGRFLSADTIIQDPFDSQAYNRYSYVRNNPLKYIDPSGHSWLSKMWKKAKRWFKKHARAIGAIIAAAVVAIVAPPLLASGLGIAAGSTASAAATGALAGAASGAIQTKSLKGALKGALFGAVGAVAAVGVANVTAKVFNITQKAAHSLNVLKSGVNKRTLFKAALHGLTRGAIQAAQGGKFKAGFMSGLSSAFDVGTKGYGGFVGRTTIMAVVGGTASALGGGKFANGAVSGAFVHMFNAEGAVKLFVKHIHSFFRSRISVVLDDAVLDTTKASRSANTLIYKKDGTFETAIKEFESLAVDSSIKIHRNGSLRTGVMENGETISVRNFSSGGDITLQMSSGGNHIKIRYSGLARLPDDSIEAGFLLF